MSKPTHGRGGDMIIDILACIIALILHAVLFLAKVVLISVLVSLIVIATPLKYMLWYKRYMTKRFVYIALEANGYRRIA
jgi:hypothetical protein